MRSCVLLFLAIALAGCPKEKASVPPDNTGGGSSEFDERQACTADTDCAAVEIECCDHCNGGQVVGVHKDYASEVMRQYASHDECAGTACTKMACIDDPEPICKQGICGLKVGKMEDTPALPPP